MLSERGLVLVRPHEILETRDKKCKFTVFLHWKIQNFLWY